MRADLLTMLVLAAATMAHAQAAEPAVGGVGSQEPSAEVVPVPRPVPIKDEANQVECSLPAPYWSYWDRAKLASQAQGGCGRPGLSPNMMFVLDNKDALARVWAERVPRRFLMRGKDDLETYVRAFGDAIQKQVRGPAREVESAFEEQDGMIVHWFALTMPLSSGTPGCGTRPAAGGQVDVRYVFVQCLVRPKDADAMEFKLFCAAPADVYAKLKPEFDYIIGSFRYTGPVADQFFVPDAPADKVPTAKDAASDAGTAGGGLSSYGPLIVLALIVGIWLLMRRRKAAAAA